ncbi:MAG: BtpA/SgcQ family protein [Rhizobiaceae bacterium]|nr:BtpA/SgcQ family protein [Rhizobiaceae bacterium]
MNRYEFRKSFGSNHAVVLPVIHVIDAEQTIQNMEIAFDTGCPGVFLINHDFGIDPFLPIITEARSRFPEHWIGINFLAVTGKNAFPILANLEKQGTRIDGYWADDARIDERSAINQQTEASEILEVKRQVDWNGLYFGGTAFKKQREVNPSDYSLSAKIAGEYMDVVTTSGIATGKAADTSKIETFRNACGDLSIALASGITPENVHLYSDHVDCLMVATGINVKDDFYNIDPKRLNQLFENLERGAR